MIALAMCGATGTAAFQIPVFTRPATGASSRSALSMAQPTAGTGTGKSLQYNPEKYGDEKNAGNYRKLSEALEVWKSLCVHARGNMYNLGVTFGVCIFDPSSPSVPLPC